MKYIIILVLINFLVSCKKEKPLFELLNSEETGIDFANVIIEKDTSNILDSEFIYNGGGVAVGDLNGDGLQDIYFTGNQVKNRVYLNKGNLHFEDITKECKAQKYTNQWSSGINILDINQDGLQDIYVCNTMHPKHDSLRNNLFINQGNDKNGIPHFIELAKEYGLDDPSHSSSSQFFDYDNDGDMDLFVAVNLIDVQYPNQYYSKNNDGTSPTRDKFFKNDWNDTLKHPVFTDVSIEAGIVWAGYSHSSIITDFNEDGWQDIYVANDYLSNDLIFINNKNGTFTNRVAEIFKHQSFSAMGSDIGDINNDGLLDMFTTEMMPYTNKRRKLFVGGNNYSTYILNEKYKYDYQFLRNTLQLNRGNDPKTGLSVFSDIAFLANVEATDWSWTPLFADFDNDGFKDLMVTNGFPRDVTDHDFGAFRKSIASTLITRAELYSMIPEIKVPNFFFKNNGDLTFTNKSKEWGNNIPSFSNGAATADFDNDGDLDIVVNNIDDKAFFFRNNQKEFEKEKPELATNYVNILLEGTSKNPDAFGVNVKVFYGGKIQVGEVMSGRGYLSKSENILHFGLGKINKIDSVIVDWKNGKISKIIAIKANQLLNIAYNDELPNLNLLKKKSLIFNEIDPKTIDLDYVNLENDYIDFNMQSNLPHKFSQYGPAMSVGDMNNDGLDDVIFGGSSRFPEIAYFQAKNGKFIKKEYFFKEDELLREEDLGLLLFDADNDNDNDLYVVRGSNQHDFGSPLYQDLLLINDGKGNFKKDVLSIPKEVSSGQVIKASDIDNDGDLDLFIGARVKPKSYPEPDRSFILRNDTKYKDKPVFTDITEQFCPDIAYLGLISDALFSDFDNDGYQDLIIAGEWMPISFMKNNRGKSFTKLQNQLIFNNIGWWNSLVGADFDNDGDIDYMAGNFGQNTFFKCSDKEPIRIYAKDFDNSGTIDPFISCYLPDSTNEKHEYFYHTRDDMVKQTPLIRKKFTTYGALGSATVADVFTKDELVGARVMQANWMSSSYIENLGNGQFRMSALPIEAQIAPIYAIIPYDFDQDGLLDLMMIGNDYGMELLQGRADAFYGLVLKNEGKNQFKTIELNKTGFFVPNDARALSRITIKNKELILATQNRGPIKIFEPKLQISKIERLNSNEVKAKIILKNGQIRSKEFYYGSSFLSQEHRNFVFDNSMKEVLFFDKNNRLVRKLNSMNQNF